MMSEDTVPSSTVPVVPQVSSPASAHAETLPGLCWVPAPRNFPTHRGGRSKPAWL